VAGILGNDWYDTDDVYVNYAANGYYLYNRRYPTAPGNCDQYLVLVGLTGAASGEAAPLRMHREQNNAWNYIDRDSGFSARWCPATMVA